MRPTNPGVWYIMGEALRVCVDLDLQNELKTKSRQNLDIDGYTRDKRRRIFGVLIPLIDKFVSTWIDHLAFLMKVSIRHCLVYGMI